MPANSPGPEKQFAFEIIERNSKAVALLNDSIFYFGELGLEEHETVRLMSGLLAKEGFKIETGVAGFPTGMLATYGSGKPVIALHTECDANPDNSQVSGVCERKAIIAGAPGHCEGHNSNAAVMVAGAIAVKRAMERFALAGTLKVFVAPAEEQLLSRPYFVRDGYFADVDCAFHDHIGGEFATTYGLTHSAAVSAKFIFLGESVHAATAPWKGRDALDGVMMMDAGMAQYREHMTPAMRAHRVVTEGGLQPNVIPARASIWWYFRDATAEGARLLFEQAKKIARGAAMMTNTSVEVEVLSAVWPVRGNQTLAELVSGNIELAGMPEWTPAEQDFAKALQVAAGVQATGLGLAPSPLKGPATQRAAANDCGDVSWVVPMGRLTFPGNVPEAPFHHWSAGSALATSIAHKGAVAGAKALAASAIDIFLDPSIAARARETFAVEIGGTKYAPLIPLDQKPPLDLNRAEMEKWREKMRAHYVTEKVEFA